MPLDRTFQRTAVAFVASTISLSSYAQNVVGMRMGWDHMWNSAMSWEGGGVKDELGAQQGDGVVAGLYLIANDSARFTFRADLGFARRNSAGSWENMNSFRRAQGAMRQRLNSVEADVLISAGALRRLKLLLGFRFTAIVKAQSTWNGPSLTRGSLIPYDNENSWTSSGSEGYKSFIGLVFGAAYSPVRRVQFDARYVMVLTRAIRPEEPEANPSTWYGVTDGSVRTDLLDIAVGYDLFRAKPRVPSDPLPRKWVRNTASGLISFVSSQNISAGGGWTYAWFEPGTYFDSGGYYHRTEPAEGSGFRIGFMARPLASKRFAVSSGLFYGRQLIRGGERESSRAFGLSSWFSGTRELTIACLEIPVLASLRILRWARFNAGASVQFGSISTRYKGTFTRQSGVGQPGQEQVILVDEEGTEPRDHAVSPLSVNAGLTLGPWHKVGIDLNASTWPFPMNSESQQQYYTLRTSLLYDFGSRTGK